MNANWLQSSHHKNRTTLQEENDCDPSWAQLCHFSTLSCNYVLCLPKLSLLGQHLILRIFDKHMMVVGQDITPYNCVLMHKIDSISDSDISRSPLHRKYEADVDCYFKEPDLCHRPSSEIQLLYRCHFNTNLKHIEISFCEDATQKFARCHTNISIGD